MRLAAGAGPLHHLAAAHAESFVLIAGGIGMSPLYSMASTLAEREDCRELFVFYAASTASDLLFRQELDALDRQHTKLKVVYVLSKEAPPGWSGERGRVDARLLDKVLGGAQGAGPKMRREYFLCGPLEMMNSVHQAIVASGVSARHIHTELFNWV